MSGNPKPTRRAASDSAAVLNGNGHIAKRAAAAEFAAEAPVSPLSLSSAAKAHKRTAKAAKEVSEILVHVRTRPAFQDRLQLFATGRWSK